MADFLTSLAMRIEPLTLVRPRLPSWFEPAQLELSGAETEEAAAEVQLEQPQQAARAIETDTPAALAEPVRHEVPPRDRMPESPAEAMPEPSPQPDERAAPVRAPEPRPDAAPVHNATLAREHPRVARLSITADRAPPPRAREPVAHGVPVRVAPRIESAADELPAPAREPRKGAATPAVAPAPEAVRVRPALVAPRTRFDALGEPPHRGAASATSEPTIHVTIGRVEVRAVATPARGPAKPAPSAVMSLEDYLRTRSR